MKLRVSNNIELIIKMFLVSVSNNYNHYNTFYKVVLNNSLDKKGAPPSSSGSVLDRSLPPMFESPRGHI